MQSNINSTFPLVDIVLAFAALGIAFFLLFKITQFINNRPDLTALFSIVAMFCGFGLMIVAQSPINGLVAFICGAVGLFASALNYRRAKEVTS